MKIWIKILLGIIIGVVLGLFIAPGSQGQELIDYLAELMIRIGRYVVFPLVFFSLVIGTFELKREKKLLRVYGRIVVYLLLSAVMLIVIGILSVLIFSPERIPILIEQEQTLNIPGVKETLLSLFPENLFQVLVGSGHFLLPVLFLAFLLGINLNFDLRLTSPVVQFFDAVNRVFYHINSLLAELFGLAMVVIAASSMVALGTEEYSLFKQILIILGVDSALVIFAIYPGLLYLLGGRVNPYKWLYAVIGPALIAFFTRDEYLAVGMLVKHGKENLGVSRRVGTAVYPLFAFFGRAGTALVTSASFLLVLKSYSSLEITVLQVFATFGFSLILSLALGSVPGLGAFVALSLLCNVFGKGLQEGYLILKPIAPLLISFGVLMDVVTSAFVSLLISKHEDLWDDIDPADYV